METVGMRSYGIEQFYCQLIAPHPVRFSYFSCCCVYLYFPYTVYDTLNRAMERCVLFFTSYGTGKTYSVASTPDAGKVVCLLLERQKKTPHFRSVSSFWCSRQESNLEHWYRKPVFYPLNYESVTRGSGTRGARPPSADNDSIFYIKNQLIFILSVEHACAL